MHEPYVHGHDPHEHERLEDQASALVDLLHHDTSYPAGSRVLEVGCGVGAQTVLLARRSPGAEIVSFDVSPESVAAARARVRRAGLSNVTCHEADLFALPFAARSFDHVFVCFVLEHLARPLEAIATLRRSTKPGGTLTLIEGDHGSAYFSPEDDAGDEAIACLVRLQARAGGDARIGRKLRPLLARAGLCDVRVSPRLVYADGDRPDLAEHFTRKTFAAMIDGVRARALAADLIAPQRFDAGVRALHRAAEPDGVFCYTFFKAIAREP
jgi:SAM-dependent methyltransferase